MNGITKSKSTKLLSALLAVLMIVAMLPTTAFAWSVEEGTKCTSTYGDHYVGSDGEMIDVIFGPFFICDCSGPNYGSLNQEQIDRFMKQFENPERLIRMNGTLMSVPYKPEPDLSR